MADIEEILNPQYKHIKTFEAYSDNTGAQIVVPKQGTKTFPVIDPQPSEEPALVSAADDNYLVRIIYNNGSQTVFMGKDEDVTIAGTPLKPGGKIIDDLSKDAWYGVTETGTADLRVMEVLKDES